MDYLSFNPDTQAADLVSRFYKKPPLAFVHSFGCQQNVNDGERIQGVLSSIGYGSCEEAQQADVIVFNTCAVREHAEKKVLSIVGNLKALKAENPNLIIGICGCMVQQQSIVDKIKKSYPYVDLVFGVNNIDALPSLIAKKLAQCGRIIFEPADREDIVENVPIKRDSAFKAWVPIMYGCDNFCSYCIVPYVRGRERSRNPEDIYTEVSNLVAQGYKEITLLGQNVNSYGKGLEQPIRFAQLLEKLCEIDGQFRMRFMSSHPKDATKELIDVIAAHPDKLCTNIHLPIQSGSNRVLQLMNRNYTAEQYMELIDYAKEKISDVTFSSDILVGFPGETEADFLDTLQVIKTVGYMQLFTFIYSKRSGTKAATMPDPVPHTEKAERINRIKKEQETITRLLIAPLVGQTVRVLVEGEARAKGKLVGRLDNNVTVQFAGEKDLIGKFALVDVTGVKGATTLLGKLNNVF